MKDVLSIDFSRLQTLQNLKHEFLENCILLGEKMNSYTVEAHEIIIGFEQGEKLPKVL